MPSILTRPSGGGAGGGASVSISLSDSSPRWQEEITLTATATGFTGTVNYRFYAYNQYGENVIIQDSTSNTVDWQVSLTGTVQIKVEADNGTDSVTACEDVTIDGLILEFNTIAESTLDYDQIELPFMENLFGASPITYNCTVFWINEDGTLDGSDLITAYNDAALTHTFATGGKKYIQVTGDIGILGTSDSFKSKIRTVNHWGGWYCFERDATTVLKHFQGASCNIIAKDAPTLSNNPDFRESFHDMTGIINWGAWELQSGFLNGNGLFDNTSYVAVKDWGFLRSFSGKSISLYRFFWNYGTGVIDLHSRFIQDWSNFTVIEYTLRATTVDDYEQTLVNIDNSLPLSASAINFGSSKYRSGSAAATARANILASGITITDGGAV